MQLIEIIKTIEKIAPSALAAAWDNTGMQVAGRRQTVHSLAVSLDPTPAAVRRAAEMRAELLVTHHPLLLAPRLPSVPDAFHETLGLLFQADMALYAAHTSLDAVMDGPAGWLARELGLRECRVLEPVPGAHDSLLGFGLVGDSPAPPALADLLALLGRYMDAGAARLAGPLQATALSRLRRIAYCPGSGASLMRAAAEARADIFITGDVKHHDALDAPLPLLDVGHHPLEEEMTRRFAALLDTELQGVHVAFLPSVNPLRSALRTSGNQPAPENAR